ncbi:MAG: ThuA domain-containing protein, partial [Bacteroidota bacterium]
MKKLFFFFVLTFPISLIFSQAEVLHYVETTGFDHNTRDVSLSMFQALGTDLQFTVVQDNNGSEFDSQQNLSRFAVVVFSNTSGANGLSESQRNNFEAYIAGGGSYLGIHAASDTYRHSSANGGSRGTWDWYAETVAGCSVQQSPNHTSNDFNADMRLIPSNSVLDTNLPNPWNKDEEWYYWENGYLNSNFTMLLEVESTGNRSYDAARMAAHYRELSGGGRAFYTSMGHARRNFESDANFRLLMKNAMSWMLNANTTSLDPDLLEEMNPRFVNPSTKELRFLAEIPRPMKLELELYDLSGRLVATFFISNAATGSL